MTCEDLMTKEPVWCVPNDSAARVAKVMKTEDVGSIPICDSRHNRKLVGIITDRDLALYVGRPLFARLEAGQSVMTREPFTCKPEDDLQNALYAMQRHQVRRIPVVDGNGQLLGIIAQADIATRGEEPKKTAETVEKISRPSTARAA